MQERVGIFTPDCSWARFYSTVILLSEISDTLRVPLSPSNMWAWGLAGTMPVCRFTPQSFRRRIAVRSHRNPASQKPVPLERLLAKALRVWRLHTKFNSAGDQVFVSPHSQGRKPYWGQSLMATHIRRVARGAGIIKKIGRHTFRHTCARLLRASGADITVVQELLRHASCRVTFGHLHAGGYRTEASSAEQDRRYGAD